MAIDTRYERLKKVVGGVRSDTAPTTTDGDPIAFRVNEYGELMVVGGSGGTARGTDGGATRLNISGSSVRTGSALTAGTYKIFAKSDCWIVFGDVTCVAVAGEDDFIPEGTVFYYRVATGEYCAVIRDATDVANGLILCRCEN